MSKSDEKDAVEREAESADVIANDLRALVSGGAAYEGGRRGAGRPATLSRVVEQYSDERRTPSRSGLPKWKGTAPGMGTDDARGDTDPGIGPGSERARETPVVPATEAALREASQMHVTEPSKVIVTGAEMPSDEALESARVITIPKGDKTAWAEQIAAQVRGTTPEQAGRKPVASEPKEPEASVIVAAAPAKRSRRDEPTVAREDAVPEAPPVESRREEKRTELRMGVTAVVLAALLVGVFIGRWFWMSDTGGPRAGTSATTAPSSTTVPVASIASLAPAASTVASPGASGIPSPSSVAPASTAPSSSATGKHHGPKHGSDPGHGTEPQSAPSAAVAPAVTTAAQPPPAPVPPTSAAPVPSGLKPF